MISNIKKIFDKQKEMLKESVKSESLKTKIANIFKGRVGNNLSEADLQKIYEEGKLRYEKKIPPGYKDAYKGGDKQYGDLVMWKEILAYAKDKHCHIVFVSSDTKDDWYLKEDSQIIAPFPQLYKEFFAETQKHILIYSLELFLKIANEKEITTVKLETIKELKELLSLANNMVGLSSGKFEATENVINQSHIGFTSVKSSNKNSNIENDSGEILMNS